MAAAYSGLSPHEAGNLTYSEICLLLDKHQEHLKLSVTMQRNAILNALANMHRKKGADFIELFDTQTTRTREDIQEERKELFGK